MKYCVYFYVGTSDMYLIFINITLKLTLESLVTCKIWILIASLAHATGGEGTLFLNSEGG